MKPIRILLPMLLFMVIAAGAMAQPPKKAAVKVVIALPTLTCDECKAVIENWFWKKVDGILAIEVLVKKKVARITYAPDRIDLDNIRLMIADLGFDADSEKASLEGYKRLPKDCREKTPVPDPPKPEDEK